MAYQVNNIFSAITSGSTSTSSPWNARDYRQVTVSWASTASLGPSRITIEGAWVDSRNGIGNASQTTSWSLITGINIIGRPADAVILGAGAVWLRATVAPANQSVASATSVTFFGQSW